MREAHWEELKQLITIKGTHLGAEEQGKNKCSNRYSIFIIAILCPHYINAVLYPLSCTKKSQKSSLKLMDLNSI